MSSNKVISISIDPGRRQMLRMLAATTMFSPFVDAQMVTNSPHTDSGIVATEWLPLEMLLTLGVTPLAVAEAANYRYLVQQPVLSEDVTELGLRTEPNLELMAALKPALIVYAEGYGPPPTLYDAIAPSMAIAFSDKHGHPLSTTCTALLSLAAKIDKEKTAREVLAWLERDIASLRLAAADRITRPLLFMALVDARHALVFGKNSLFMDVMTGAGIPGGWQGETNFWGSAVVSIERLASIDHTDVICFTEHNDETVMNELASTALWKAMPFVRSGQFHRVPGLWYYGGPLTALRFCHLLKSLLNKI